MCEYYRKGSIIPRRLVRCASRKTQHLWKFGCDVRVEGRKITALRKDGAILRQTSFFIGGRNGKPRRYDRAVLVPLHVYRAGGGASI